MLHNSARPDTPAAKTEVLNQLNKGINHHPVWILYHLIITFCTRSYKVQVSSAMSKEKQGDQKRSLQNTTLSRPCTGILGRYFMEPSDYFDVPTYKILHYIRSAGLLRG
jgi:hypothetical protein